MSLLCQLMSIESICMCPECMFGLVICLAIKSESNMKGDEFGVLLWTRIDLCLKVGVQLSRRLKLMSELSRFTISCAYICMYIGVFI